MLISLPQGDPESRSWRFELRHLSLGGIPRGLKLRLLTEDLLPFENNEAVATTTVDQLYVEVALEPGEGAVWEIDPVPENYDREILLASVAVKKRWRSRSVASSARKG